MKRTITITMTLALVFVSGFTSLASAKNVNYDEFSKLTQVNGGDGGCKGDEKDPCEPPRNQ